MKAGVVYPQVELGGDTGAVKAFAQAAEELGYDHVVIYDHVLGAVHAGREPKLTGPYKETDPFYEPLITYGAETHKFRAYGVDPMHATDGRGDIAQIARGFGLNGAKVSSLGRLEGLFREHQA